jgi:hypothetical protein
VRFRSPKSNPRKARRGETRYRACRSCRFQDRCCAARAGTAGARAGGAAYNSATSCNRGWPDWQTGV